MRQQLSFPALAAVVLAAVSTTAAAQNAPAHVDPGWLRYDSAGSRVEFALVAGLTGANGGMNFNGAIAGALTLTVPTGWQVVLHFRNADQMQPHSAMVIPMATPIPVGNVHEAFAHAATHRSDQGMPPDAHDEVTFTADRAGVYLIFCAVPGHGVAGMWLRLDVSDTAHHPSLVAEARRGG